jgi:peroxiredoxin Q/BCP
MKNEAAYRENAQTQCRAAAAPGGDFLVVLGLQKVPEKEALDRRFSNSRACLQNPSAGISFAFPMKKTLLPLLLLSTALAMSNTAKAELNVGDKAPEVTGVTETGEKLNLADVYSKQPYTLVYFYPKADTPGCTAQGCSLRDAYESLTKQGVAVIGVSLDQVDAQKAFKEKYHFPFTLIADPDKTVVGAFGVTVKTVPLVGQFATREAFLIKDGKIVWADHQVKVPKTQAEDVLKVISDQKG